jgi:hypothetical protein
MINYLNNKARKFEWLRLLLIPIIVFAATSCEVNPKSSTKERYNIQTNNLIVQKDRVFWYDKDTVVFSARKYFALWRVEDNGIHIFVWKPPGQPKIYAKNDWPGRGSDASFEASYLCAGNGRISYSVSKPIYDRKWFGSFRYYRWLIKSGPIGHELSTYWDWMPLGLYSGPRPCENVMPPAGHIWSLSRDGQFVVDLGRADMPPTGQQKVLVIERPAGNATTVELPGADEANCAVPSSWEPSFLLWDCGTLLSIPVRKGGPVVPYWVRHPSGIPVWLVSAHRSPKRYNIDFDDLGGARRENTAWSIFYTKSGLFMIIHAYADLYGHTTNATGLYKIENDKPVQILRGELDFADMSPDGCHVAFYSWLGESLPDVNSPKISVANLCS